MCAKQASYILEAENLCKSYGSVKVIDHASIKIEQGQVHGLIGSNAAGKTVFSKLISGIVRYDSGNVRYLGEPVRFSNFHQAQKAGIYYLSHENVIINHFDVAENIHYDFENHNCSIISYKKLHKKVAEFFKELHIDIDPYAPSSSLRAVERDIIVLARAIYRGARLIILDELFASNISSMYDHIKHIFKYVCERGNSIIYISHRFQDLEMLCDNVTILSRGHTTMSMPITPQTQEYISYILCGCGEYNAFPSLHQKGRSTVLSLRNVCTDRNLHDISFDLRKGEILGIFGMYGSGRTAIARAIFGLDKLTSGEILLRGTKLTNHNPVKATRKHIGYVPENRLSEGLFSDFSLLQNLSVASMDKVSSHGIICANKEFNIACELIQKMHITTPSAHANLQHISNGNQQKVLLSKWLLADCSVLIFDEPTNGLDAAARLDFYNLINKITSDGTSVLFISSDFSELMGMCQRILILRDGHITGELDTAAMNDCQKIASNLSKML